MYASFYFFDDEGLIVCTFSNALLKYTLNLKHDTFLDTLHKKGIKLKMKIKTSYNFIYIWDKSWWNSNI